MKAVISVFILLFYSGLNIHNSYAQFMSLTARPCSIIIFEPPNFAQVSVEYTKCDGTQWKGLGGYVQNPVTAATNTPFIVEEKTKCEGTLLAKMQCEATMSQNVMKFNVTGKAKISCGKRLL